VRVYVPFVREWHPYSMRRPVHVFSLARNLLRD
jgi:hypothetical protein